MSVVSTGMQKSLRIANAERRYAATAPEEADTSAVTERLSGQGKPGPESVNAATLTLFNYEP